MTKKAKRLILALVVIVLGVLSPFLLMVGSLVAGRLYGWVDEKIYADETTFSSEAWKNGNRKTRYAYVNALLAESGLEHKTQSEIREILGEPDRVENGLVWYYETERPGWRFIDFSGGGVSIEFDGNQKVIAVSDTRWID